MFSCGQNGLKCHQKTCTCLAVDRMASNITFSFLLPVIFFFICLFVCFYFIWLSGYGTGVGSVGVMGKEEVYEKVVGVRRMSDRAIANTVTFLRGCVETVLCIQSVYLKDFNINQMQIKNGKVVKMDAY